MELEATDDQLDAPFLYGSARDGWVDKQSLSGADALASGASLEPLFQAIVDTVHAPPCESNEPFQMLVSTIDHSNYVGRIAIGRIERGSVRTGQNVALLPLGEAGMIAEADMVRGRVMRLYGFEGLERVELQEATAGEIVGLAGMEGIEIGTTLADPEHPERLSGIAVGAQPQALDAFTGVVIDSGNSLPVPVIPKKC